MRRLTLLIAFLLTSCFAAKAQIGCNVQTACGSLPVSGGPPSGSPTFFCEGETVTFLNTTDPDLVDVTIICWGDGMCDTFPGPAVPMTHFYDFSFDTCLIGTQSLQLAITMTVINECDQGVSQNCIITFVQIQVDPVAAFFGPDTLCVGEEALFLNATCENADTATYQWFLDGVFQSFGQNLFIAEFPNAGTYEVMLVAANMCGADTFKRNVIVLDAPVAEAEFSMSPPSGCVELTVHFTNLSSGHQSCLWLMPNGIIYLDSTSAQDCEPVVLFPAPMVGDYDVYLIVENPCGLDTFHMVVTVTDVPAVSLTPPPPGCGELLYTPDVTYSGTIDSVLWTFQNGAPGVSTQMNPENIQFHESGSVSVTVWGPCGMHSASQPLVILNEEIAIVPIDTLCSTAPPFFLQATPQGDWSGPGVLPNGYFTPALAQDGWNTLTYSISFSGCEKSETLDIFILETQPVEVGPAESVCIKTGLYQLAFSPPGGTWSGAGIEDSLAGIFNTYLAGDGQHLLAYEYADSITGCITTVMKAMQVVAMPSVAVPDTFFTCAALQDQNLPAMMGVIFTPPTGGQAVWSGDGIVNPATGLYNNTGFGQGIYEITIEYVVPPGCDTSVSFILVVDAVVPVEAGPDHEVCQNEGALTLSGWPLGGVWSGPDINQMTGEINLASLQFTTHTYSYTLFAGTPCETSDQVQVVVHPPGGVSVEGLVYACETDPEVVLPVPSQGGGVWTGPAPVIGGAVNLQDLPTPSGVFGFTYTVPSLPEACNSASLELIVEEMPVPAFTTNPTIPCQGAPVVFQNLSTGGDTYLWDFGDGGPQSNEFSPTHTYTMGGDFNITLLVSSQNPLTSETLCDTVAIGSIHIVPPAIVDFTTDVTEGCGPLTVTIENISQGEDLGFLWDLGGLPSTEEQPGVVVFQPGVEDTTYTITLTASNSCEELIASALITVHPLPQALFGVTNLEPCSGMTIQANNTSVGNPQTYVWYLDGAQITTSLNPAPFQFFTGDLITTHTLALISANDCGVDTFEQVISVIPTDVTALFNMSDTVLCAGDTLLLTAWATPGAEIYWDIQNTGSFLNNQLEISFSQAGVYGITLYAEGCGYDSMNMSVNILPLPDLSVAFDPVACPGIPVEFEVSTNGQGLTLNYGDGFFTNAAISEHAYMQAGTWQVSALATTVAGCQRAWEGSISILPDPVADFTAPPPACEGEAALFASQSTDADECLWMFGDGGTGEGCTASHTYLAAGTYPVTLIAVSSAGCRDTVSQLFQVKEVPEAFFFYEILEECSPGIVVFQDASSGAFGVQWSFGDSLGMVEKTYPEGGTYLITLTATNGECADEHSEIVTILQTPAIFFEVKPNCTVAAGSDLSVSTSSPADWVMVSGPSYDKAGNFHAMLPSGEYLITAESTNGCSAQETAIVLTPQEIFIELIETQFTILLGQTVDLQLQYNLSGLDFQWTPPNWLSNPKAPDPRAEPHESVTYVVSATDLLGCVKYDTAYIQVIKDRDTTVYLPNAFTPDNNGVNDVLMVRSNNPGMFQVKSFLIYDAHGALVFESRDCVANLPSCGWDGNFRGKPAQQGPYRWQYELEFIDGVVVSHQGLVLLIR